LSGACLQNYQIVIGPWLASLLGGVAKVLRKANQIACNNAWLCRGDGELVGLQLLQLHFAVNKISDLTNISADQLPGYCFSLDNMTSTWKAISPFADNLVRGLNL
jgi:hypothetical protein